MSSTKAVVEEVITNKKSEDFPVLLHFQNGDLKAEAVDMQFAFAQQKETGEKHAVVAVGRAVYHGPVDQFPADFVDTFVAVRNRKTNKVRFIQAKQATLQSSAYDTKQGEAPDRMGAELSRNLLMKQFGGRKTLRNFEKKLRMNLNVDALKDQLVKTVEASGEPPEQPEDPLDEEHSSGIRPEFNKTAKRLEDVYSLYDIVPEELMNRLNKEADAVLATNIDDLPIASELAKERIKDIKLSSDPRSSGNLNTVKALIYLDALRNLARMKQQNMETTTFSDITEKVENDIRKRFSQPGLSSMRKTSYTRDKAFCHYIVLALLTSPNYEIDINALTQELSLSKSKILKFAQFVNAKPKAKSDLLTLALPESIKQIRPFMKRKRQ